MSSCCHACSALLPAQSLPLLQVYVLGNSTFCTRRASLSVPPADRQVMEEGGGVQKLARVSAFQKDAGHACGVPEPPAWLVEALADELRKRLGLHLFNFDMIRPADPSQLVPGALLLCQAESATCGLLS